jgi:hypothetical protein
MEYLPRRNYLTARISLAVSINSGRRYPVKPAKSWPLELVSMVTHQVAVAQHPSVSALADSRRVAILQLA